MSRILGIDYGEKRIGLSLSDEEENMAFPEDVIENNRREVSEKIGGLIKTRGISKIVIGLPLGLKAQETKQTAEVKKFAEKIEKEFGLPVVFENEVFSTMQVMKTGASSKEKRDASAAALILQSYLDRHMLKSK